MRSRKILGADHRAEEALKGTVIVATTFVIIGAIFVALTERSQISNTISRDTTREEGLDAMLEAKWNYTMWDPDGGVDISAAVIHDKANGPYMQRNRLGQIINDPTEYESSAEYTNPGGTGARSDTLYVYVVRDNDNYQIMSQWLDRMYHDYILFAQNIGNWWGDKWRFGGFSYETIIREWSDNMSIVDFAVGKRSFSAFITVPEGQEANYSEYIWVNNYTMRIGKSVTSLDDIRTEGVWATIGKLLTFQLVETDDPYNLINILISIPFYAALAFVVITLISRFIPFIGGG